MEDKFRVIIAGGRDFDDFRTLSEFCMHILQNKQNVEVVSGKANGADKLGEQFARFMGYPIKEFPANWDSVEDKPESQIGCDKSGKPYWKIAGMVRNKEMAEYADALIAFWDKSSKGTAHMIDLAKKMNLKVRIYKYEQPIKEEDIPWWKQ